MTHIRTSLLMLAMLSSIPHISLQAGNYIDLSNLTCGTMVKGKECPANCSTCVNLDSKIGNQQEASFTIRIPEFADGDASNSIWTFYQFTPQDGPSAGDTINFFINRTRTSTTDTTHNVLDFYLIKPDLTLNQSINTNIIGGGKPSATGCFYPYLENYPTTGSAVTGDQLAVTLTKEGSVRIDDIKNPIWMPFGCVSAAASAEKKFQCAVS